MTLGCDPSRKKKKRRNGCVGRVLRLRRGNVVGANQAAGDVSGVAGVWCLILRRGKLPKTSTGGVTATRDEDGAKACRGCGAFHSLQEANEKCTKCESNMMQVRKVVRQRDTDSYCSVAVLDQDIHRRKPKSSAICCGARIQIFCNVQGAEVFHYTSYGSRQSSLTDCVRPFSSRSPVKVLGRYSQSAGLPLPLPLSSVIPSRRWPVSEEIWTALNIAVLRADEENPPTNGIVRHDSHMRKSELIRAGIEPGSPWWEASRLTTQPPWHPRHIHCRMKSSHGTHRRVFIAPFSFCLCRLSLVGKPTEDAPYSALLELSVACYIVYSRFPTTVNRVESPAGSPDLRKWESCRTMPLVGGFSRGPPISPALTFRRRSILASVTLIGSQDLAVKSRPNLFNQYSRKREIERERAREKERRTGEVCLDSGERDAWPEQELACRLLGNCVVAVINGPRLLFLPPRLPLPPPMQASACSCFLGPLVIADQSLTPRSTKPGNTRHSSSPSRPTSPLSSPGQQLAANGEDVNLEQYRNARAGETGDPRENLPSTGIVWHNSHVIKCGSNPRRESNPPLRYRGPPARLEPLNTAARTDLSEVVLPCETCHRSSRNSFEWTNRLTEPIHDGLLPMTATHGMGVFRSVRDQESGQWFTDMPAARYHSSRLRHICPRGHMSSPFLPGAASIDSADTYWQLNFFFSVSGPTGESGGRGPIAPLPSPEWCASTTLVRPVLPPTNQSSHNPTCQPWLPNPSLPRCTSPCMIPLPCRRKGFALRRNYHPDPTSDSDAVLHRQLLYFNLDINGIWFTRILCFLRVECPIEGFRSTPSS
ncbi:hypothetical protein PR048_014556 [Dryococelus australis]|uniref:Uncharacterized protein n=1 Tax=Dryococelus australis TaxID=614101 RepID=A0ABQ9HFC7_9NEOP|nr:hypothetical protein PR048_014556 [Dryococelus australis]